MCTLSFYPDLVQKKVILTFNRDEMPHRSGVEIVENVAQNLIYPRDNGAGGTWLGVGNRVVCLLNGGFVAHVRTLPYRKSRGVMLLESFDFETIESFFSQYDFNGIEPFTLVAFENGVLYSFRWTGNAAFLNRPDPNLPQIWSSATLYAPPIQNLRRKWFFDFLEQQKFLRNNVSSKIIWNFHQTAGQNDAENGLRIKRANGIETVSQSQIIVESNQIQFFYYEFNSQFHTQRRLERSLVSR